MNLQCSPQLPSLRVLIVNPLCPCSRLIIVKIMSGVIFGKSTPIDLILLVYSNEKPQAESLKSELIACAFGCMNSVTVTIELPRFTDADVFCIITNFVNPNSYNYKAGECDDQFDMLYLVLKVAHHWSKFIPTTNDEDYKPNITCKYLQNKGFKPLIMTDGLVTLDIVKSISKILPTDLFFCPTSIPDVAANVIGDYLKVRCPDVNEMRVWAADDQIFHVVIKEPVLRKYVCSDGEQCKWDNFVKEQMRRLNLDYTQFNDSWMKTTFVDKVIALAAKNPYGNICRAAVFSKALRTIWEHRTLNKQEVHINIGVISDGSLGTFKGYPYVFPVIFKDSIWQVDDCKKDCPQLKLEIKRINKVVKENHLKLISYCKEFLVRNVINQEFAAGDQDSSTYISSDSCQLMRL